MRVVRCDSVDAMVVFDLDDAEFSAGGTRLAPDVTEQEGALLARAMTYKYAVLGAPVGGAKGLVRASPAHAEAAMVRYCDAIRPMVEAGRFATGADLGTSERDFRTLRPPRWSEHVLNSICDGVGFEDVLTGYGVTVAADTALGGLEGRTVAVEGLGKVGLGVVREMTRRGVRVVAVSTVVGCVSDPDGLDADRLEEARLRFGDDLVSNLGRPVLPREALFEVPVDVVVPGARTGVVDRACATRLSAAAVVPAANVPYTADGLEVLRVRGIAADADFVCNAATVVGYRARLGATQQEVLERVEGVIGELVRATADDPAGPFAAACRIAEEYLLTWRTREGHPGGPPLA